MFPSDSSSNIYFNGDSSLTIVHSTRKDKKYKQNVHAISAAVLCRQRVAVKHLYSEPYYIKHPCWGSKHAKSISSYFSSVQRSEKYVSVLFWSRLVRVQLFTFAASFGKQCQKLTHVLLCSHVNNMLFIYVIQYRKSFINILEGVKYLRLKFRLHSPTFLLHSKREFYPFCSNESFDLSRDKFTETLQMKRISPFLLSLLYHQSARDMISNLFSKRKQRCISPAI